MTKQEVSQLYVVPTLKVLRQPPSPLDCTNAEAIVFISGFNVVLDVDTLSVAPITFAATGMADVTIQLSNGGTIAGVKQYVLKANFVGGVTLIRDGTNLVKS